MHPRFRLCAAIGLFSCMIFLAHCTRLVPESHFNNTQKIASPYTMPTQAYLALAQNQQGEEKQALQLMAAGRAIYDGQWRTGITILNTAGPMYGELADEKSLLLAKVDLIRDQPNLAITKLAAVKDRHRLPIFYQVQYHDMLAYAYQSTGAFLEAVIERTKLEQILPDEASKANNRRALWLSLTKLSQPELDTFEAENAVDGVLQGWISLADISRKYYADPQEMLADLRHWQVIYPHHPANHILPATLDEIASHLITPPRHIALLLPVTGSLAGPGQAIQDGFMAAYQASGRTSRVSVRVYNTDHADATRVYQQAIEDGADYVVGPLTKSDVALVAKMPHPVPTILLNDVNKVSDGLAFQFGLSPTNEARQVAARARKSGYTQALIIAPEGPWGSDGVHAFSSQWSALGGHVVETWQYGAQSDISEGIRTLLHASDYAARVRPTKPISGKDNETAYKRRRDFDVIVLIAYPSKARQIMPLLRYYFAGDVPVYATSSVYSGTENTAKDRDLNGIVFCDMPWVFAHQMGQHNWPEQLNSYNRLYALGMDSYALSNQLNHLMLFPALGISDKSGVVYMTDAQRLSRILVFAQFRQGLARILDGAQEKSVF